MGPGFTGKTIGPARREKSPTREPLRPVVQDHPIRMLQRVIGNQASARLLSLGAVQRQLARGESDAGASLNMSQPGDSSEREADRVAEQILRMRDSDPHVQRSGRAVDPVPSNTTARPFASSSTGSSRPLAASERSFFEPRFGRDLGDVRLHAGASAARAARSLHAHAFTVGRDVVFGAGRYAPETAAGRRLLAHELAHVVQQERAPNHPVLQRYVPITSSTVPYDRLSDDRRMAVKSDSMNAWAMDSDIDESNKILAAAHSVAKIEKQSETISVPVPGPPGTARNVLEKFRLVGRKSGADINLADDCGDACQQLSGSQFAGYKSFVGVYRRAGAAIRTGPSSYRPDDRKPGGNLSTTEQLSGEIYTSIFKREFQKSLSRVEALKAWSKLPATEAAAGPGAVGRSKEALSKKYGINEYAVPQAGQGITISTERDVPGASPGGYNFHFGFSLVTSGHDFITAEDFEKSGRKYWFDMYGPASKDQSFAQQWGKAGSLGNKTTTMVVEHPGLLKGPGLSLSASTGYSTFGTGALYGRLGADLTIPLDLRRRIHLSLGLHGQGILELDAPKRSAFLVGLRAGIVGRGDFAGGGVFRFGAFGELGGGHFRTTDREGGPNAVAGYGAPYGAAGLFARYSASPKHGVTPFVGLEGSWGANFALSEEKARRFGTSEWLNFGLYFGASWK